MYQYWELGKTTVSTITRQEILEQYWPHWYKKMCEKFGQAVVDAEYSTQHCVDDWVAVNWAWPPENNT